MRLATVVVAVIVSLGLGEVVLRALDLPALDACDTTADYAIPDPVLGFRGAPNGTVAGVRLNAQGMRGPVLGEKSPGETRILFLGDSTCWGLGVPLDASFAGRATAAVEGGTLLLGAFPGYSSYHSRVWLDDLLPMQPDVVVFYVGARNDGVRARYYPDADIPARRARLDAVWHRVRLLRLVEAAVDRSYRSLFRKLRSREARARVPPEAFRENRGARLAPGRDAGLTATGIAPPLSEAFENEEPQMRRYREILRDVADAHGATVVSVDEAFREETASDLYFEDHYHLSERGHAIVAERVSKAIARARAR